MKLAPKTYLAFGIILALLVTIGAVGYMSLTGEYQRFTEYRTLARTANAVADAEANMLMVRLHAKDFIIGDMPEAAEAVRDYQERSAAAIEEALALAGDPEHVALLDRMAVDIADYGAGFDQIVQLQARREDVFNGTLNVNGPQIVQRLSDIMRSAFNGDDVEAAYLAAQVERNLLLGRLYAARFLLMNDDASRSQAQAEFDQIDGNMATLLRAMQDPTRRRQAEEAGVLIDQYRQAFTEVAAVVTERNRIRREVLDRIGPAIGRRAAELSSSITEQQHTVGLEAMAAMETAITVMVVTSIVSVLLGAAAAFLMGRMITRPISAMTNAMGRLADGDTTAEIGGSARRDEIGAMAKAVAVFKDNMIRNRELERTAAEERERNAQKATEDRLAVAAELEQTVGKVVTAITSVATQLKGASVNLSSAVEETGRQSSAAAAAAEQTSANVNTVAAATEELTNSFAEIARQVSESAGVAREAVQSAEATGETMRALLNTSNRIGEIVQLINSIAEKTHLLALNATIEAVRAGDAGRGFGVVAGEVKSLANQTAQATEEIREPIESVQTVAGSSSEALSRIRVVIDRMDEISTIIAAAVEEQQAATRDIAGNVQEAAGGTGEVSRSIGTVNEAAANTGVVATQVQSASEETAQQAATLRQAIDGFLVRLRAG